MGSSAASKTQGRRKWHVSAGHTVSLFLDATRMSLLTRLRTIAASITKLVIFYKIVFGKLRFMPEQIRTVTNDCRPQESNSGDEDFTCKTIRMSKGQTDPFTKRSFYPNPILADGGIFARDRRGLPTLVPPNHQWDLPNSKPPRDYFVSSYEIYKLETSHEGRWESGGWQHQLFCG